MKIFSLFILSLLLIACHPEGFYKEHQDFDDGVWNVKNEPTFSFEIADTTQAYNVYYLPRNAIQYQYNNLYVKHFLLDSKNRVVAEALNELVLMDEKTGKPLGDGLGDLFDHKILMLKNYHFSNQGKYTIKLRQYMRQDDLLGILSMGISVEPITK
jgi:gliding motility-associated lipoprotein GldH